jgi:hypothetical protein
MNQLPAHANARAQAIENARCYNTTLTREFMETKTNKEILYFCHPSNREVLTKEMGITEFKSVL